MAKLIMTRGLPASGKSTWASQQAGFVVVTKDDIRAEFEKAGWIWSRSAEKDVIHEQEVRLETALLNGQNAISADTNFGKHETRLRLLAHRCKADFEIKDFTDVPVEECIKRNAAREKPIPEEFIWQQYNQHVRKDVDNSNKTKVTWVNGLPECVLVDIDGTVALHDGRSPYDTAKAGQDKLNEPVARVVWAMANRGYSIIFMSGRDEQFRELSEDWLNRNGFPYPELYMRSLGDKRNDAIVKNELFDKHIRGKYNVVCVFDDRDRVVKRWRELGLACLQVAYGNF